MLHLSTVDVVLDAVVNKKYRLFSCTLRGCVVRKLYNYKTKQSILVTPCVGAEIETVTERAKHRPTGIRAVQSRWLAKTTYINTADCTSIKQKKHGKM